MKSLLTITFSVLYISTFAKTVDTVDVWKVQVNDKELLLSDIFHLENNHLIHIGKYKDSDTLKFTYWTDSGQENKPWKLFLKDSKYNLLGGKTNETDRYLPNYNPFVHKNCISFSIGVLKSIIAENRLDNLLVYFYHSHTNAPPQEEADKSDWLFTIRND